MDKDDKKSKQISYCAVLLNNEEDPQSVKLSSKIYSLVGDIVDRQPKSIGTNISNALQSHWNSSNSKMLEKIQKNYHAPVSAKKGVPTPREFLLYLVNKYREENKSYENDSNVIHSFLF